jgi:WD40 repeat protein
MHYSLTASGSHERNIRLWNVHCGFNSCCPSQRSPLLIVRGQSDDGTAKLWDLHHRGSIQSFLNKYQINISIPFHAYTCNPRDNMNVKLEEL